jgi:hypothetical protein
MNHFWKLLARRAKNKYEYSKHNWEILLYDSGKCTKLLDSYPILYFWFSTILWINVTLVRNFDVGAIGKWGFKIVRSDRSKMKFTIFLKELLGISKTRINNMLTGNQCDGKGSRVDYWNTAFVYRLRE